jgi:serine/threonine protein kinase
MVDGSIELYWSNWKSDLRDLFRGRAGERRKLARQAFEHLCKTEMHHLEKDQCFIQGHHNEALSILLRSADYKTSRGAYILNEKHASRRALKSYRLHAQLLELRGLCKGIRKERDRYAGAVAFCDSLARVEETEDGRPVLDGLTHQRKLGEGGYGDIHVYRDEEGREYAVKVTSPRDDAEPVQKKLDFMHECDALTAAGKSRAQEIVKLVKPPLRTDTGKFVLVMEFAPHGNLYDFIKTLNQAEEQGLDKVCLTKVRAMILGDILRGLRAAHQAGVIHGDLKPPNIVIGSRGVAKITDFGTAQIGKTFAPALSPPVDNTRWLSPEILVTRDKAKEGEAAQLESWKSEYQRYYRKQLGMGDKASEIMLTGLSSTRRHVVAATHTVGPESDLWALGVIAFNLAYGKDFDEDGKLLNSQVKEKVLGFQENQIAVGNTYEDGTFEPGYFRAEHGGEFAGIVNHLLRADPKDRKSLDDLLNEWPSEEVLGGQATRNLIVKLASGTWKPGEEFDETEYVVSDEESSDPD